MDNFNILRTFDYMSDIIDKWYQNNLLNVAVWTWVHARRDRERVIDSVESFAKRFCIDVNDKSIGSLLQRYKRMQRDYVGIVNDGFRMEDINVDQVSNEELKIEMEKIKAMLIRKQKKN